MIIVTGAAGFVGSNLIRGLNRLGEKEILAVDELTDGHKFENLVDCQIADYWDRDVLRERLTTGRGLRPRCVFHQGACSETTEWDGRYMMENNYSYSTALLDFCLERKVPLIYASSAAVYGAGRSFQEDSDLERPLNVYGYSKLLFDQYVRRRLGGAASQVVGLRYFNVYGPGEAHKGGMASVAYHLNKQVLQEGEARLFEGSDGYAEGEQLRDFVYVDDVVNVNLWFFERPEHSGIFNVGTGQAASFNELADAVIEWHGKGSKRYIPFPGHLADSYQSFTQADITKLRSLGYDSLFLDVREGVRSYLDALDKAR